GKRRFTAIGYGYDAENDRYLIQSGWGKKPDWYRNLVVTPQCTVRKGWRRFTARAAFPGIEECVALAAMLFERSPETVGLWVKLLEREFDPANPDDLRELVTRFPIVALKKAVD